MERANQRVHRWYGDLLRMNDERLVKKVFKSEVISNRKKRQTQMVVTLWSKGSIMAKGMSSNQGKRMKHDKITWRKDVHWKFH